MRISPFVAVLDACVLAPMPIADTLLRLAEEPAFYTPRWSADILKEIERTLLERFGYNPTQVARRIDVSVAVRGPFRAPLVHLGAYLGRHLRLQHEIRQQLRHRPQRVLGAARRFD